ncbi:MAG TPA: hypothetical protein ENF75_04920 [Acidilobales archaeon]|nr:hypothetical protein [Acidilobales archaeon]
MNSLITVMILVVAVIILGLALMSFTASQASIQSSEIRLMNFINEASSNLIVYKEYQNGTTLWIGINEVVAEPMVYYVSVFSTDWSPIEIDTSTSGLVVDNNLVSTDVESAKVTYVNIMGSGGNFFTLPKYLGFVTLLKVEFSGNPVLLKLNVEDYSGTCYVLVFIKVGSYYYEVGRITFEV